MGNKKTAVAATCLAFAILVPATPASAGDSQRDAEATWVEAAGSTRQQALCEDVWHEEPEVINNGWSYYPGLTRQDVADVLYDFCYGARSPWDGSNGLGWTDPIRKRRAFLRKLERKSDGSAYAFCAPWLLGSYSKERRFEAKMAKKYHVSKRHAGQVIRSFCLNEFGS